MLLMVSCSDLRKTELKVFELVDLSRPETVLLSSVCEEIVYIPLEKGDKIIGTIMNVKYSAGKYAIQSGSMISVFDSEGHLDFILDRQGRGPGEYDYASTYDFIGERDELIVYYSGKNKLLFYNSSAELVKELGNLPDITSFRVFGNDKIFLSGPSYSGQNEISQAVINFEGDTLMAVPNKFLFQPGIIMQIRDECVTYICDGMLFYHEVMDDTIFSIEKDLKHLPYSVLNTGDKRFTAEKRSNLSLTGKVDAVFVSDIVETENYFFVKCSGAEHLIRKKIEETIVLKDKGLQNDLDGGMPFYPHLQIDDKYLVQVVDAFKFNLWLESDHFKTFNGNMDKKDDFHKLAERLMENDNPVLILCRVR